MADKYTQLSVTDRLKELVEDALKVGDDSLQADLSAWQTSGEPSISFKLAQRAHSVICDRYVLVTVCV